MNSANQFYRARPTLHERLEISKPGIVLKQLQDTKQMLELVGTVYNLVYFHYYFETSKPRIRK